MKQVYDDYIANVDPEEYQELFGWSKDAAPTFEVNKGDMFEFDWSDSDFIFANSTCFQSRMMEELYK